MNSFQTRMDALYNWWKVIIKRYVLNLRAMDLNNTHCQNIQKCFNNTINFIFKYENTILCGDNYFKYKPDINLVM